MQEAEKIPIIMVSILYARKANIFDKNIQMLNPKSDLKESMFIKRMPMAKAAVSCEDRKIKNNQD